MKKKNLILIIIAILIVTIAIVFIFLNIRATNDESVAITESMIESQKELEAEFIAEGYTIDEPNVIVNPYGNSPLTALIMFETEDNVSVKITIEGKDEHTTFTNTFAESKEHYLPVYGLYAGTTNEVIVEIDDETKTIEIETEELPDDIAIPESVYADKTELDNELYFFTPSSSGYTCAYDVNGDIRWYFTNYALWKIDRLKNGHLLVSTERLINSPYYMTGLYEMDLLGKIYTEFSLEGGYHHDYYEMEDGNLLVASDDFDSEAGTVEDYIVELDRNTGEIVKAFDLKEILNMEDGKSENWTAYDWFHNNSVWYDEKTNSITLSGRHQDTRSRVDYETGKLNWIIGDPTNWSEEYQEYFFTPIGDDFEWQWSQHAAMITPEGYVFILDNGNNKSKIKDEYVPANESYTRGVMYKIDTEKMTIEQVWEYGKERGSEFYSPYISDVDYLAIDHYIVHSGGIVFVDGENSNQPAGFSEGAELLSDTVELLDDEIIFEIKLPTNNYRVEKMDLYIDDQEFVITDAKRLGSLGNTRVDNYKFLPILSKHAIDEVYESHNIEITKEIDRLVVKGQFKRENTVNIVLYQNMISRYYNVKISKKPYTALCVDIFTEEENENGIVVTKYINDEGLKGRYSIYIEIDGVLYDTERYVEF